MIHTQNQTETLPDFEKQRNIGDYVVDAYISERRMAIEVDGEYWHSLPNNIERDKRKDAALASYGITVIRLPERKVRGDIKAVLRESGICP